MKVAVVHDYFVQLGGAERVAEELFTMFNHADLFATVALPESMPAKLRNVPVQTSWMRHLPRIHDLYRLYFLLYPLAVSSLNVTDYDLVISSSSGYVKGVKAHPSAMHICYCHTPMRWVWAFDSYSSRESFGTGLRSVLRAALSGLRRWDEGAARQPDHFVANSHTVAAKIKRAYGRYAEVIFPPIDVDRFRPSSQQEDYYIILSRLVPYKRIDVAVEAFTRMGRQLVVIGDGPALPRLKASAGPTVKFLGRAVDAEVEHYVARCRALIFPGEEDFGMAPLEVAAAGRPTIAFQAGGATETIIDGLTGSFFGEQTAADLMKAVSDFEKITWDSDAIRAHAQRFDVQAFRRRFKDFLRKVGSPVD